MKFNLVFFFNDTATTEIYTLSLHDALPIFHLAAWYKIGARASERGDAERTNVEGTRHVLELMRELHVPKGVYTSTVAVFSDTHGWVGDESYRFDGSWLSEYDRTKWTAHYQVALPMIRDGLPLVIV